MWCHPWVGYLLSKHKNDLKLSFFPLWADTENRILKTSQTHETGCALPFLPSSILFTLLFLLLSVTHGLNALLSAFGSSAGEREYAFFNDFMKRWLFNSKGRRMRYHLLIQFCCLPAFLRDLAARLFCHSAPLHLINMFTEWLHFNECSDL